MSLADLTTGKHLVLCVGPGGVGKTTTAAALGLDAAKRGRRVLVLTVDPARRLADALGLSGLDDHEREVPVGHVLGDVPGRMSAAMLDTKASFDALIDRIAPDEVLKRRIMGNRVYQAFSRTLARSHAYVAMERLGAVLDDPKYDLCILDTPPALTALEILDAPGRLSRFLEEGILRSFTSSEPTRLGPAMKLFAALAGGHVARELAEFFEVFFQLRHGFAERAARIDVELTRASTTFLLVTSATRSALLDARRLSLDLTRRALPVGAVLVNRSYLPHPRTGHPLTDPPRIVPASGEPLTLLSEELGSTSSAETIRRMVTRGTEIWTQLAARNADRHHAGRELITALRDDGTEARLVRLPELYREARDLAALEALARQAVFEDRPA